MRLARNANDVDLSQSCQKYGMEERTFERALEIEDIEKQEAFVRQQCPDDPELCRRILELLEAHHHSQGPLDSPLLWKTESSALIQEPQDGDRVGRYVIRNELGRGGMGIVYRAEESSPLSRTVALKIIKLGMDTRSVIARFESERQTLAILDHPNITRVFDAGSTPSGKPYFVMELVEGYSITRYCHDHGLGLRDRLQLFTQVCDAVQHAHQKGIIHRDIKPSNVLVTVVDGAPTPKIIDFGVAKATGEGRCPPSPQTRDSDVIGTPQYMSPEQALGTGTDVDTRSDIYGLGVLLYELLTGSTPFGELHLKSFDEIRSTLRQKEPERPSQRLSSQGTTYRIQPKKVRGDLDWICATCLAKDPNQRYASASDLSRDIQRYLDGRAVHAVAPSFTYRLHRFAKAHRSALLVAGVIFSLLLSGTIVGTTLAVRATQLATLARENANAAQKHLDEAQDANEKLVEQTQRLTEERDRAQAMERQLANRNENQKARTAIFKAIARFNEAIANDQRDKLLEAQFFIRRIEQDPPMVAGMSRTVDSVLEWTAPTPLNTENIPVVLTGWSTAHWARTPENFVSESGPHTPRLEDFLGQASADERLFQFLLEEQEQAFGRRHLIVAHTLRDLGAFYRLKKRHAEAAESLTKSLEILEQLENRGGLWIEVGFLLSLSLLAEGDQDQAEAFFDRAYVAFDDLVNPTPSLVWLSNQAENQILGELTVADVEQPHEFSHPTQIPWLIRHEDASIPEITRNRDREALFCAFERFHLSLARHQLLSTLLENEEDLVQELDEDESRARFLEYVLLERISAHGHDSSIVAHTLWYLGEYHGLRGHSDSAISYLEEASALFSQSPSTRAECAEVSLILASVHYKKGEIDFGDQCLAQALGLFDSGAVMPQSLQRQFQRTLRDRSDAVS